MSELNKTDSGKDLISDFAFLNPDKKLSEERLADLFGRANLGDIDGLASEARIPRKEALRLARGLSSAQPNPSSSSKTTTVTKAATTTRKTLKTSDARRLARDLFAIFAKEACSKFAKNRFLLLNPSLDEKELQTRFKMYLAGKEIFDDLNGSGKLSELRKLLSNLSFVEQAAKTKKKEEGAKGKHSNAYTSESDTVRYFSPRRKMIELADSLLTEFGEFGKLTSFLLDTDVRGGQDTHGTLSAPTNALKEILKNLDEVDTLRVPDPEAILSDSELAINDQLQGARKRGSLNRDRVKEVIEDQLSQISTALRMNIEEEEELRKAVFEGMISSSSSLLPFGFERSRLRSVFEGWRARKEEELSEKFEKVESALKSFISLTDKVLERLVLLDQVLAVASLMEKYALVIPAISRANGVSFRNGLNLFLLQKEAEDGKSKEGKEMPSYVHPVSYCIGSTTEENGVSPASNVVMLTGANSGGKTTLLTTLAAIHILALYGLPVPCEKAEITPVPIYLFRRRMTKKIGSLEQALRSLIPVFADSKERKLVLIDEFEALTEPGAAGRIIATMMNKAAIGNSLVLLVTHLARETIPHVKLPIRVDGIEASGFDSKTGELKVDRQPKFNHIGSSAPQHVVLKLSKLDSTRSGVRALYQEILEALESESSIPVQAPLFLPWVKSSSDAEDGN